MAELLGARLTASTDPDHSGAVDLTVGAVLAGPLYVRLVLRGPTVVDDPRTWDWQLPELDAVSWRVDGLERAFVPAETVAWEPWSYTIPAIRSGELEADATPPPPVEVLLGGFLLMPGAVEVDPRGPHSIVARVTLADGSEVDVEGILRPEPQPEPAVRHPLVDHLVAAGASQRLADLVERRANGELLDDVDGAALLELLPEVTVGELREDALVGLADVVDAVRQRRDAVARARLVLGGSDG